MIKIYSPLPAQLRDLTKFHPDSPHFLSILTYNVLGGVFCYSLCLYRFARIQAINPLTQWYRFWVHFAVNVNTNVCSILSIFNIYYFFISDLTYLLAKPYSTPTLHLCRSTYPTLTWIWSHSSYQLTWSDLIYQNLYKSLRFWNIA